MNLLSNYIQNNLAALPFLMPEGVLLLGFIIMLILDLFKTNHKIINIISILCLSICCYLVFLNIDTKQMLFSGFFSINPVIQWSKLLIASASIVVLLANIIEPSSPSEKRMEFIYLFPIFVFSLFFMSMSSHLMSMFFSIEFVSIVSYIYIAIDIRNAKNAESATKYILFGAMSTAIMLFGLTLLYGITGTLFLNSAFLAELSKAPVGISVVAIILFLSGILYKVSSAPFHYFTPDVYEGSNPKTLTFISTLPKIAGFTLLINFSNFFSFQWQGVQLIWPNFEWEKALSILAIATMFIGNLSALSQKNLKRIIAYSSISHTGFILMGILSFSTAGINALFYYLIVFTMSNIAIFLLIDYWEKKYQAYELKDLNGLGMLNPFTGVVAVIILASFTGLPPFAGFMAKLLVFSSVYEQYSISRHPWLLWLLISGVVNTVIALFYYFNFAKHLFFKQHEQRIRIKMNTYAYLVCIAMAILIIYFGVFPSILIK